MNRLVNRTDCHGGFRSESQVDYLRREGKKVSPQTTRRQQLTPEVLGGHFAATCRQGLVGTYPADPNNRGRWGALDIDNHDDDPGTAAANERAARWWYRELVRLGFRPLLIDGNGNGSYHLWVLLARRVSAERLHHFLTGLGADHGRFGLAAPPEVFPRQPDVRATPGQLGNWLRLPGRHHQRNHWSRVWDGKAWLEGDRAIDFMLALTGDAPGLVPSSPPPPPGLVPSPPPPRPGGEEEEPHGAPGVPESPGYTPGEVFNSPCLSAGTIRRLARGHQPARVGQRHRKLFALAQALKGLKADCTTAGLRTVFDAWWAEARHKVGTKDEEFNFLEFTEAYADCRLPGKMDWDRLLKESEREELPVAAACYPERTRALVRVCARLQRLAGDRPFFLSYEDAGRLVGFSKPAAQLAFRLMLQDGLLGRVSVGSKVAGKASEYRYLAGQASEKAGGGTC
jgi:hypothetical protein